MSILREHLALVSSSWTGKAYSNRSENALNMKWERINHAVEEQAREKVYVRYGHSQSNKHSRKIEMYPSTFAVQH